MDKKLLKLQVETIENTRNALTYHYERMLEMETIYNEQGYENWEKLSKQERENYFHTLRHIQYEAQAYLNQVIKFAHTVLNLEKNRGLTKPNASNLEEIWDAIHKDGSLYTLRNKWSAHRSYDDPRGESESIHMQVLSNLDNGKVTMWSEGKFELNFDSHCIKLTEKHSQVISLIEWITTEVT